MRDFLSQLGREAPALSLAKIELAAYFYYTYIRVMQQYLSLSELTLWWSQLAAGWLANMPNASINICDYKLQIWSKYLNTSSVTSGFNMVSIPRKASAHSHSRSHSPNHVSRSRWILIPNGTFGLTGLAWPQVPAELIANLIEVCTRTLLCIVLWSHTNWLSFIHNSSPKSHKQRCPTIFAQMSWHLSQPQPNVSFGELKIAGSFAWSSNTLFELLRKKINENDL